MTDRPLIGGELDMAAPLARGWRYLLCVNGWGGGTCLKFQIAGILAIKYIKEQSRDAQRRSESEGQQNVVNSRPFSSIILKEALIASNISKVFIAALNLNYSQRQGTTARHRKSDAKWNGVEILCWQAECERISDSLR